MILFRGICHYFLTAACAKSPTCHVEEEEGIRPFFGVGGLFKLNRKEDPEGRVRVTRRNLGTSRRSLGTSQFEANKPECRYSPARLSMLIKISETRKKKKTYIAKKEIYDMVKGRNEDEWETMDLERYIKDYARKRRFPVCRRRRG